MIKLEEKQKKALKAVLIAALIIFVCCTLLVKMIQWENKQAETVEKEIMEIGPWATGGVWLSENKDSYIIAEHNPQQFGNIQAVGYFRMDNDAWKSAYMELKGDLILFEGISTPVKVKKYAKATMINNKLELTDLQYLTDKKYVYTKVAEEIGQDPEKVFDVQVINEVEDQKHVYYVERCTNRGKIYLDLDHLFTEDFKDKINPGDLLRIQKDVETDLWNAKILREIELRRVKRNK